MKKLSPFGLAEYIIQQIKFKEIMEIKYEDNILLFEPYYLIEKKGEYYLYGYGNSSVKNYCGWHTIPLINIQSVIFSHNGRYKIRNDYNMDYSGNGKILCEVKE